MNMRIHFRRVVTFTTATVAAYIVLTTFYRGFSQPHTEGVDPALLQRYVADEAKAQKEFEKIQEDERQRLLKRQEDVVVPHPAKPVIHDMKSMMAEVFRGENVPDDMMSLTPPTYLQNFKNPCWYERDPEGAGKKDNPTVDGEPVKLRCLPYFHLIGVDKSGTTDLWSRLAKHPEMARPKAVMAKETHWWSWRRFGFDIWVNNAPIRHFDWYLQHFDQPAERILKETKVVQNVTYHHVITGEGSPTVFWDFTGWNLMPQNKDRLPESCLLTPHVMHHLTPKVKLLLMLRDPVERLYSEYLFLDRFKAVHNVSAKLFHEGVVKGISMFESCVTENSFHACLYNKTLHMKMDVRLLVGLYSEWLLPWQDVFPKEQILVLRNEDYAKDMAGTLNRVIDFLGLSRVSQEDMNKIVQMDRAFARSEKDRKVGNMLPETREILQDFYWEYNLKLARILGDAKYLWEDTKGS